MRLALVLALVIGSGSVAATAQSSDLATRRSVGVVVASLGVATFAGAVFLGRERVPNDDSRCYVDVCPSMATLMVNDARSQSDMAFRLMSIGALAMASGVSLFLSSDTTKRLSDAEVALAPGGLVFRARF